MIAISGVPVLGGALVMFVSVVELADMFPNLHRYFAHRVPVGVVARIAWLYLPKCLTFALPVALLFAATYTLGSLYSTNQVIAIFGAGVSFHRLIRPLIVAGALSSVALFVFDDLVVVEATRMKNEVYHGALGIKGRLSDGNVAVVTPDRRLIYHADYYDDERTEIHGVTVVELDGSGDLVERIDAERGYWDGRQWVLERVRHFMWRDGVLAEERFERYGESRAGAPSMWSFRAADRDVREMRYAAAMDWVDGLRSAGRGYYFSLTDTYGKISFAFTPFLVTLIAVSVSGRVRKYVFAGSLVIAVAGAIGYSVMTSIGAVLAKNGYVPLAVGVFGPDVIFAGIAVGLLAAART